MSDNARQIRENSTNKTVCWAGLFIYESGNISHKEILESIQKVVGNDRNSVINCIAVGANLFVRFWLDGHSFSSPEPKSMWHSYDMKDLAQPYFKSNLIEHLSLDFSEEASSAWYPIPESKEIKKHSYAKLGADTIRQF